MIDPHIIIEKYYSPNPQLKELLTIHSQLVTKKALTIAARHKELGIDTDFVYAAGMLHDIGIFLTNAPSIYCYGKEPYLKHGVLGGGLMRREGYPMIARVCERHTGAGLTREDIERDNLPLPHRDFLPETMEEKLICYADKFYSKSHLTEEKTAEQALASIKRFGEDGVKRFESWMKMFG